MTRQLVGTFKGCEGGEVSKVGVEVSSRGKADGSMTCG